MSARWLLDHLKFGRGDVRWFEGMQRIPYKWKDGS
jgi:hypothetical protein